LGLVPFTSVIIGTEEPSDGTAMRTTLLGWAFVDETPVDWGSVEGVVDPAEVAGRVSRAAEGDPPSHPPIAIETSRASSSPAVDEGFCDPHPMILRFLKACKSPVQLGY
jgi:hypothetical protein